MDWLSDATPLIIGHRGASYRVAENTLAAFEQALMEGAQGVEFDVRLSADGVPVVIHDARVDRTTNGTGPVAGFTAAEIQLLDAGDGQIVPTLDDVFHAFGPRLLYNVEIKDFGLRDRGTEAAVADIVESYRLETQVLVSSFNPIGLRRARRTMTRSIQLGLLHQSGWIGRLAALVAATAVHPHHRLVDAAFMAWARRRGYRVHVWTVDDPVEAQRLAHLGVHAIITNRPGLISASLRQT